MSADRDRTLLDEQAAFYRADADSYRRWLDSLLDEANTTPEAVGFRAGRARVIEMLSARAPLGRVLEVAAGNGVLSELVAPHADELVLVDTSVESLGYATERLAPFDVPIEVVERDIWSWDPGSARFDTICFSSWLHHVPAERFAAFWDVLARALAPAGEVLFDFPDPGVRDGTHDAGAAPAVPGDDYAIYRAPGVSIRDHLGRRWRVVDVLWEPAELGAALAGIGWDMTLLDDSWFRGFRWATARR